MRIREAAKDIQAVKQNPRRDTAYWRIEKFFKERPDEVFRKRDVAKALVLNYNTVKEVVRLLYNNKVIARHEVNDATPKFSYYGVPSAIKTLEQALRSEGGETN